MKIKLSKPLFLLTLFVVLVCSLGSVSAANDIHDVTIEDTNTVIEHPEANIHDSIIYNGLTSTDNVRILETTSYWRPGGTIINSKIFNRLVSSNNLVIEQGADGGVVQDSMLNNEVEDSNGPHIQQGIYFGAVRNSMLNNEIENSESFWIQQGNSYAFIQNSMINNKIKNFVGGSSSIEQGFGFTNSIQNSMLNNAIIDFTGEFNILQGWTSSVQNSMLNNAVLSSSGKFEIVQGEFEIVQGGDGNIQNSCLNNLVYESEGKYSITQNSISNSLISNATLFCDDTNINQNNLTGVNGCLIAIGCTNYTKTIDNLVDTNFFNLVIGNHEIINWHW